MNILQILRKKVDQCQPGDSHRYLKTLVDQLRQIGKTVCVCTQNIDDFESQVGLNAIQVHGSLSNLEKFKNDGTGIVLYGDLIDKDIMGSITDFFTECDLLLMIGTSGNVIPWSILPKAITKSKSPFIYINIEDSKISPYATVFIKNTASKGLQTLLRELRFE